MSRIGQAVVEAQERTGKSIDEIVPSDLKESDMDDFYAGQSLWVIESEIHDLNASDGNLSLYLDDIERVIGKLTKLAEKAGKRA